MNKIRIELVGDLLIGHDGELYIETDIQEYNVCQIIQNVGMCKFLGDKERVRLIIEQL